MPVSLDNSEICRVVEQHRPTTRAPFSAAVIEKRIAVITATAVSVPGRPMRRAAGLSTGARFGITARRVRVSSIDAACPQPT